MAIGDIMEISANLPAAEIARIDAHLAERNLPTLSRMRWRFLGRIRRIIERGSVRSETEYHALRNIVDDVDDEAQRQIVCDMLAAYEEKASATRS
ncbi:MAG: hypothetical protein J7494_05200 [Sphingobium sp.]|nr:hypothetical protein [Sphingobium sp.]